MNFIISLFTKHRETTYDLVDQEVFDFMILGTIYKQTDAKYEKLSSNTEFVFDKLTNDQYDHILIVRLQRASKQYNNTIFAREGDFYFNFSFFQSIYHSELNDEIEEIGIDLIDAETNYWSLRLHFYKNTNSDNLKFQKFKLFINELLWIQKNKQPLPQNQTAILGLIKTKPSSKLEMADLVQQKKMLKKLKRADRTLLTKPTNRIREEKEIIGDVINYFLQQNVDTIKQIYAGKLFILYPELVEIRLVNPIVIMALNIISKTECRLELYNQDRQLLLMQSVKDFISFEVDKQDNILSWVYFDGYNSIVLYFKFDVFDGATSMCLILQRSRISYKNQKELSVNQDESLSNFSTATTITVNQNDNQKKNENQQKVYYRFQEELKTLSEGRELNGTKKILAVKEGCIYLEGIQLHNSQNNISMQEIKNFDKVLSEQLKIKKIVLINHKYDQSILSSDAKSILVFNKNSQEVQLYNLQTKQQIIYVIKENIVAACENNNQFYLISEKSIYWVSQENNIKQIHQQDMQTSFHSYTTINCTKRGTLVIGTNQGYTLIFEKGEIMKLINIFDGLGDIIKDINFGEKENFIIINNGYYFQLQQVVTRIFNGYFEKMDLKPFPLRIQLNPDDLIMMGIFNQPDFQLMRIDVGSQLLIAHLDSLQIIWNIEQILQGHANSYQIFILPEEAKDQLFIEKDILTLMDSKLVVRNQIL